MGKTGGNCSFLHFYKLTLYKKTGRFGEVTPVKQPKRGWKLEKRAWKRAKITHNIIVLIIYKLNDIRNLVFLGIRFFYAFFKTVTS